MSAYEKAGEELAINSATVSSQHMARVAAFADGGFVVVWSTVDPTQDGDGGAIKAQRFDAAGNAVGGEFLVNTSFAATQTAPAVTTFADGSFAIAWATTDTLQDGSGGAIKAQLFSAAGVPTGGEFLVNVTAAGNQSAPSLTTLANGTFLVGWDDAGSTDVLARLYAADGTALGGEFRLNTNVFATQSAHDVIALADGGFVAVWRSTDFNQDGSNESVKGQVFDASGAKVGGEFLVNTNTFGAQNDPSVAALAGGGFVVTWVTSYGADDGSSWAIKAQVFSASGAKLGGEFLVNTAAAQAQQEPVVTASADGGFVIAWTTLDTTQDGSGFAVKAQAFDAAGTRVGTEFVVNTQATGNQSGADMATLSDGRVVATWTDTYGDGPADWGISAQLLAPAASPPPPVNQAPSITSNGGGGTASLTMAENGTLATTVAAVDPDGNAITYTIVGGADAALFQIGVQSGMLRFQAAPDFEAAEDADGDNVYEVIVAASDGSLTDTQALSITVSNVDEPITFSSSNNFITPENHAGPFAIAAADPDSPSAPITYRIAGGADAALFAIDATSGALTFISAPDYEAPTDAGFDRIYDVVVEATNGAASATDAIRFTVYNVNEAPVITSNGGGASASIAVAENATTVTTVTSTDPELTPRTYSIAGGADAARFTIDASTGALRFVSAPNFEAPTDAGGNNVYDVIVRASDGSLSDTQAIAVTVVNVNEAPAITSNGGGASGAISLYENAAAVTTVAASDPEGNPRTYAIVGGADAARFAIDASSGALTFVAAPDFEAPGDAGADNVYNLIVSASDGSLTDTQSLSVTVMNADEAPVIVSDGGGASAALVVDENATAVTTLAANDPEGGVSYAIVGGADAARLAIDAVTGALSFVAAPDFEAPADADGDNVYEVIVGASDGSLSDTQALSITVGNVNEAPVITSNGGGAAAVVEIAENGTAVTTVIAGDPEGGVGYAIAGGTDAALFVIDASTGALSFVAAPDREAPGDADGDNVYEIDVTASDGVFAAHQSLVVTVADVWDHLTFQATTFVAYENYAFVEFLHTDGSPDTTYEIVGGADAALFALGGNQAQPFLHFHGGRDFETPTDADGDGVYEVQIRATDGAISGMATMLVTVADLNEAPVIGSNGGGASAALAVSEGSTAVTTVAATDDDGNGVTYALAGGADAALFAIDASTGTLSFVAAPDFEAPSDADGDNVYEVVVSASDGTFSDSQALSITVGNVNEAPVITSHGGGASATLAVGENAVAVTTVAASDAEGGVSYALVGGADAALFAIDASTGALSFVALPDFEAPGDADADNVYEVVVSATDGTSSDTQALSVAVGNVNEAPTIVSDGGGTSAALAMGEGQTAVTTVVAADADGPTAFTYAIVGGGDGALFVIDAATGALSFAAAPDYEAPADEAADNFYNVVVAASDGELSTFQAISILIGNVNEGVSITSAASAAVLENATAVTTVTAQDLDGDAVVFAISGGADAARFAIDASTGALSFVAAPNFEAPADADANNVYEIEVSASDGSLFASQALSVTVGNVNEAPVIVSGGGGSAAGYTVGENTTAVATVVASDVEGAVTYSLAGGADAMRFSINASTGALSFLAAPDFDAPADADGDNVYDVVVSASDGSLSDTQALSVTVGNLVDGLTINGTQQGNTLSGSYEEDTIRGLGGNDTLRGLGAADVLDGGDGADRLIGGAGADVLTGGAKADIFEFEALSDSTVSASDRIVDFNRSQGDRIELTDIDANTLVGGNQAFSFIGTAAFSNVAGQLRYFQQNGDTFIAGDVDGNGVADFQIVLDPLASLVASDFIL